MVRINKYIASSGICSRRKAEEYILAGRVRINDNIVNELGYMVDELNDIVYLNDKKLDLQSDKVYIMLNKPKGYITTNDEQFNRPSTSDIIKEKVRVFPIGRLDMDTEGLLLFTNDGEFANNLIHPRNKVKKIYVVKTVQNAQQNQIDMLVNGVDIGGYITKPADVVRLSSNCIKISITEGKNRQVRRMCSAVDLDIINLKRIQVGIINLGDLEVGSYRYLTLKEVENIKKGV